MGEMVNALQSRPSITDITLEGGQFLTFMLAGKVYALGILHIREIIDYGDLTEVPMMPDFIKGVINLRGRVVPVVDLSARFGQGVTKIARRTCIVIVEVNDNSQRDGSASLTQLIGIVVDAVNEVVDIQGSEIEPPPSFGTQIRTEFISGMAKRNGRFIILLAIDKVLSVEEMSHLGQMGG
jgi:purine-binding chemotaxis protein CheW